MGFDRSAADPGAQPEATQSPSPAPTPAPAPQDGMLEFRVQATEVKLASGSVATILQAEGALPQQTAGGQATSARRTIYYFQPDGDEEGVPTYEGSSWPVVLVPPSAQLSVSENVQAS